MELMEAPGMGQGTAEPRAQAPQIEIRNLRKVYPAAMGEVVALDDLSLTIDAAEIRRDMQDLAREAGLLPPQGN